MSSRTRVVVGLAAVAATTALAVVALRDDGRSAAETSPAPVRLEIGGRPLDLPLNAVRFVDQRPPGPQPRVDLALTWPA